MRGARSRLADARKYQWLGTPTRENGVCALTKASGVTSAQHGLARALRSSSAASGPAARPTTW